MSFRLVADVLDLPGLAPTPKLVLAVLASYANAEGLCFPSPADLVRVTGFSMRTVYRQLTDLRRAGFVEVVEKGGGRGNRCLYRIIPNPDSKASEIRETLTGGETLPTATRNSAKHDIAPPTPPPTGEEPVNNRRDALFEAVCEVAKKDWKGGLTKQERSQLNGMVSQLRQVGATPGDVKARAARWPWTVPLTAPALVTHWSELGEKEPAGWVCPPHRLVDMTDGRYCVACKKWEAEL